jgi:hypothetical protein
MICKLAERKRFEGGEVLATVKALLSACKMENCNDGTNLESKKSAASANNTCIVYW